ncbi:MAG TPA: HAD-IC family P-type ATPase, partial [Rugosimonospora sp.]|nr:HAD-IC family P-type ATPase [Rugosimonospora sp.]
ALRVRVEAVGEDTALAGIQRLVAQAQASQGRAQVLADRFAAWLFYIATTAGAVTFVVWWALGDLGQSVTRTVTVLVIACPHALGLAIPLVVALSTALSARAGILVRDRLALERMRGVDAVLFDKTGTLTEGAPALSAVATAGAQPEPGFGVGEHPHSLAAGAQPEPGFGVGEHPHRYPVDGVDRAEALRLAAGVEADSEHPLARAIVAAAGTPAPATGFRSLTGRGVQATINDIRYAVGGPALLRELDAEVPAGLKAETEGWSARGAAVLHLLRLDGDGAQVLAAFALADRVRPQAREAIAELRQAGVRKLVMITGDARPVAEAVAAELGFVPGVDEVYAEVLPADKDRAVAALQERGLRVAMVGDGVNDAPALARADVGIAIGAGTDVAIESAGVVLASSDPRGVLGVIRLSRASYRKMVQNLAWAAGYNIVAIPLAAGVLAFAGVSLSPAVGAVLMSASTIVVALNAQLLRRVRLTPAQQPPQVTGK